MAQCIPLIAGNINNELRSVGDRLHGAWHDYYRLYSSFLRPNSQGKSSYLYGSPPEFVHQLEEELAFITKYETKIQQVRLAMSRAHGELLGRAPINTLPTEILARIFRFVLLVQPCSLEDLPWELNTYHLRYPDFLAQVCTLWRRIAVSSRSLWCHVDLSPYVSYSDKLITRAETYLTRAGKLPVELHVTLNDDWDCRNEHREYSHLYSMISRVSDRVEMLKFALSGPGDFQECHKEIFSRILLGEESALKKLVISSESDFANSFIYAEGFDPGMPYGDDRPFELNLTQEQIESAFASVTAFDLQGVFPLWSSTAYHGLVDLRLTSTGDWSQINETELVAVLKASPGLRILHFGLWINILSPEVPRIAPVDLQDLQVVNITETSNHQGSTCPSSLLRLLSPGIKPLRLSIGDIYEHEAGLVTELERFFARSRIARFFTQGTFPPVDVFLPHAAYLECIAINQLEGHDEGEFPPTHLSIGGSFPHLRSIIITHSILFESELRSLVNCCPSGVVLSECRIIRGELGAGCFSSQELSEVFPTVVVDHSPYRSKSSNADWDILD
ncbi:unnamed protein product [Rhizoctonia solani]|uniref:F-box domain-containing protein n=1 Tax=Rhizoctonia solani TaxID=456999 RepID=A0A8H3BQD3_9AGAM|nr:unnamed protein product [Rhizoctonia solani]